MLSSLLIVILTVLELQSILCYDDDDWKKDPNYIYCYTTHKFDGQVNVTGNIYSPKYGNGTYPPEIGCEYEISVPANYRIRITFKDLDIEASESCNQDKLVVLGEDESNVLGIFCGSQLPRPLFSQKGDRLLRMQFGSDYMIGGRGFHIYYEASPYLEECPAGHIVCKNRNCVPKNQKCDGVDNCEDGTDEEGCKRPVVTPDQCGLTPIPPRVSFRSPDRIVGGEAAVPHSWPWQVSLQENKIEPSSHSCGGTLINSQWVLSAAHCFPNSKRTPSTYRIHIGSHHKFKKDKGEQVRYAERIIGFPDLEHERLSAHLGVQDDIALVKLNAPVEFTDTVQAACVPALGRELSPGEKCYATGWGLTRGSGFSDVLKQASQTVLSQKNCTYDPGHQICVNHPTFFNSPCHGDSGGPLVCQFDKRWYVMGDTSYATADNFMSGLCAMPANTVIFSKVSDKTNWIRTIVEKYS